jgi:hypothetical protein
VEGLSKKEKPPIFKDYFNKADIVVLAENIGHGKHSDTIIPFLEQFKKQIKGVFVELSIDLQPSIDTYMNTGEVNNKLEYLFQGALKEGKDLRAGTLALFDKAKELNIKVFCYDASKRETTEYNRRAKYGYWFIKGECRDEDMFNNVIDYYKTHSGKYLVIVGSHHMGNENFEGDYKNFGPRLKEELADKCVSVRMTNIENFKKNNDIYDDVLVR